MGRSNKDVKFCAKPVKMAAGGGLAMEIRKGGADAGSKNMTKPHIVAPKVKFKGKLGST